MYLYLSLCQVCIRTRGCTGHERQEEKNTVKVWTQHTQVVPMGEQGVNVVETGDEDFALKISICFSGCVLVPVFVTLCLTSVGKLHTSSTDSAAQASEAHRASPEALMSKVAYQPFTSRLLLFSEWFLKVPYQESPLGEGAGVDADPLFRFDAADCLTFVEETMALSYSSSMQQFEENLAAIRYGSEVSYVGRNHLMEADWISNNLTKGFLRDVTVQYGGDSAKLESIHLTRGSWQSKMARKLQLPQERQRTGTFAFRVIPLEQAQTVLPKVPSGTLLLVVRENRPGIPTRVTHLGFVIHKHKSFLRHASKSFGRVVDEELDAFFRRNRRYERWKVSGIGLFEVLPPSPETK